MKIYARGKSNNEFLYSAGAAGLTTNTVPLQDGHDLIIFQGVLHGTYVRGIFNVTNTRIIGTYGAEQTEFTTDDVMYDVPWFDAVLDLANTDEPSHSLH